MSWGTSYLTEVNVAPMNGEMPTSPSTFEDGATFRVEIPSVEGPAAMAAVLEEAEAIQVPVHRVSQGSGIMLLTDAEIRQMVDMGADRGVEVCLFVGPRAHWEGSASALVPDGGVFGWRHMNLEQVGFALDDIKRGVDLGLRSVLIADEGLLWLISEARRRGDLPDELVVKCSALMGIANPLGARLLEREGATTLNIASDTSLARLAEMRSVLAAPLDLYIESPDSLGGFLRYHELPEIVRVGAPIHLKFGLRNAPGLYPSGAHLQAAAEASGRERVRRARVGLDVLRRAGVDVPESFALVRAGVPVR